MDQRTFVKVAKALADPTRLEILMDLRRAGAEVTCSCVCDRFTLSQPTISHHLRTLERAGVLRVRKDGQFRRLKVDEGLLREFARVLSGGRAPAKARGARAAGVRRAR